MDKFATFMGGALLTVGGIFFFVVFGTLMGAFCGWVVGLFFHDTFIHILSQIGIRNIQMWQFGAFMGFVGGFLKTKVTVQEK